MAAAWFLLEERPAHPPSAAAAMQWAQRERDELQARDRRESRDAEAVHELLRDFGALFANRNYMFLVRSPPFS